VVSRARLLLSGLIGPIPLRACRPVAGTGEADGAGRGRVGVVQWSQFDAQLGRGPVLRRGPSTRFGVLPGFVRASTWERPLASSALLPTPSGLSMFPPAPGWGDVFALGVPTEASAGE